MKIPLTPQLLGDLIDKGYKWMLTSTDADTADNETIILRPVREKPALIHLPDGYETFYKITGEPMMLACSPGETIVLVDYETISETITSDDIFEDSYFRMSEDFFKQVLDSIEDYAVFTTDKNGDINSWNTGAQRVLGYDETEIIGVNSAIFFTPEDIEAGEHIKENENAINNGRAIDERYHVCKDGTRFWGTGLVFPLFDEEEKHRGFTKIMRNLREEEDAKAHPPETHL